MHALTGGPQRSQSHRDRVDGGSQGLREGSEYLMGTECQFGKMESSGDGQWGQLHNDVHVLNAM